MSTIAKTVLKKNKIGVPTLPDFKTYCKVTVFKTVRHCCLDTECDQLKYTETLKVDPLVYRQRIFGQGAKAISEERMVFVINGGRTNGYPWAEM